MDYLSVWYPEKAGAYSDNIILIRSLMSKTT